MPTTTLRPASDAPSANTWTKNGAVSYAACTNDNSDATYAQDPANPANTFREFNVNLGTFVLPTGAIVLSVTIRARALAFVSNQISLNVVRVGGVGGNSENLVVSTPIATYTLSNRARKSDGSLWTQGDISAPLGIYVSSQLPTVNNWTNIYELYLDVLYANPPTVSAITPTVTQTTSRPTIGWTFAQGADGSGGQTSYQVKVFSAAQYGASGFDPSISTPTYDSGVVSGSAASQVVGVDLISGTTYRAYVNAAQTSNSTAQWSGWTAGTSFLVSLNPPATPTLSSALDAVNARVSLAVQGHDNLMLEQDADFEANATVGGWVAGANTTVAYDNTGGAGGSASALKLTGTGGDMSANTATGLSGVPVVAGRQYRLRGSVRAVAGVRTCKMRVGWYDSTGAQIGGFVDGGLVTSSTSAWIESLADVTAPAGAAFAAVGVYVVGPLNTESFKWDQMGLQENGNNPPPTWTRGGLQNNAPTVVKTYIIESSDDGGTTWRAVRNLVTAGANFAEAPSQSFTVYDYEIQPGVQRIYRARASYVQSGSTVAGSNSAYTPGLIWSPTDWWLKNPLIPSHNMIVYVQSEGQLKWKLPYGEVKALGRADPIVTVGTRQLSVSDGLLLETYTAADMANLLTLMRDTATLLLQSPTSVNAGGPAGINLYFMPLDYERVRMPPATADSTWRQHKVPFIEVAAP